LQLLSACLPTAGGLGVQRPPNTAFGGEGGLKTEQDVEFPLDPICHRILKFEGNLVPQAAYWNYQHTIRPTVCNLAAC